MSQELLNENAGLKHQVDTLTQGVNSLIAQLDAHKQLVGELMQSNVNLRAQYILQSRKQESVQAPASLAPVQEELKPEVREEVPQGE